MTVIKPAGDSLDHTGFPGRRGCGGEGTSESGVFPRMCF